MFSTPVSRVQPRGYVRGVTIEPLAERTWTRPSCVPVGCRREEGGVGARGSWQTIEGRQRAPVLSPASEDVRC